MDERKMIKKLLIIFTLVAQNLSFAADLPPKETHVEYLAERFVGTAYDLRVMETHMVDNAWQVELVRVEPKKPKETYKRALKWVGDFASSVVGSEETIRTYYMVRVRCVPSVCQEYKPKSVNMSFEYFESGTPPKDKTLKDVELGNYAYFYETSTTLALEVIAPTLRELRLHINDTSNQSQFPPLAIAK